ncbi:MAG: hypothetical protein HY976_04215, partial [Candidatus Kerfeldbacteria bacterium]|nr:hypothetical protein [Candidatus Kerfeldbacteria bacterium]
VLRHGLHQKTDVTFDTRAIFQSYSLPIFLTVIPNSLGNAYIPLLSPWFSPTVIGYYGFALTFFSGIYLLLQSLYQMMLSRAAGTDRSQQVPLLRRTLKAYAGIAVVGAIGVIATARPIMNLVNADYLPGIGIFRWFLVAALALGFLVVLSGYWSGRGRIKPALMALVGYSGLLLTISYVLLTLTA